MLVLQFVAKLRDLACVFCSSLVDVVFGWFLVIICVHVGAQNVLSDGTVRAEHVRKFSYCRATPTVEEAI